MINLPVDEGYAYDYLAILEVKANKGLISLESLDTLSKYISQEVGEMLHRNIVASDEYNKCLRVNLETFEAVDGAKKDTVLASSVHNLNYERYLAKTALQKRFFPNAEVTEKKN